MTRSAMRISPKVLVHLRIALHGAAGGSIEELVRLNRDLAAASKKSRRRELSRKRLTYRKLMRAVQARCELQSTVGLPGEPLGECTLRRRAEQKLVREVLSDYRDAARLSLEPESKMSEHARREVSKRIEDIAAFLDEGRPTKESVPVA